MGQAKPEANSSRSSRWKLSLRDLLVGTVVLCLLVGLALPALQVAREYARRRHCANNLLQSGMALANYHDVYGQFPPAYLAGANGQARSSWRVAILPFKSTSPFYDQYAFDEPWNSPANLNLTGASDSYYYRCLDDRPTEATTSYLAVTGAATAWPDAEATCRQDFSNPSFSILVVESTNTGIHWLEPRDLEFDQLRLKIDAPSWLGFAGPPSTPRQAISSGHPQGANVLFADGSLEFLGTETSAELLQEMLTIRGEAAQMSPGPRPRLRLVFPPASMDDQHPPKQSLYRLESYWIEDEDD